MLSKAFARLSTVLLLCLAVTTRGQESATPEPKPSPKARSVRITFLPPPLDGTISLGIYDANGQLVRVLRREADINEFAIGADALSITWDGKDDRGENVPAGKYGARGFVVGDLTIQGVGFFFNDWITAADSPRISRIKTLGLRDDKLLLSVELIPDATGHVLYDVTQKTVKLHDGAVPESPGSPTPSDTVTDNVESIMNVPGRNGTRWVIDRTARNATTTEVKQFSASGELLRRLNSTADQPQPTAVAPSMTEEKIYLLEENSSAQRVRALTLTATKAEEGQQPIPDWKVDFEKSIVAHKDFSLVDGKPVALPPSGANTLPNVKVKLQPNPLINDEKVTVELAVGFEANGSFLKTKDGLPLQSISETPGLVRAILASRGPGAIDVFQDDGAVVEQFRVTGVDQMMSFDCGGFELK